MNCGQRRAIGTAGITFSQPPARPRGARTCGRADVQPQPEGHRTRTRAPGSLKSAARAATRAKSVLASVITTTRACLPLQGYWARIYRNARAQGCGSLPSLRPGYAPTWICRRSGAKALVADRAQNPKTGARLPLRVGCFRTGGLGKGAPCSARGLGIGSTRRPPPPRRCLPRPLP